ncbi:MAG: TatD family hydrolase [Akkermansiaceae bacterium]|nr:TatD family hydrolase [Akkermansiaceae bacterium]
MNAPRTLDWTDCHNHLHLLPVNAGIMAEMAAAGIRRCVVNATCEEEWAAVRQLAADFPGRIVPALGVHPWQAARAAAGWEERLEAALAADPAIVVGECGLDGAANVDRDIQRRVFRTQVRLAREYGRWLTVHLVRAWGDLQEVLRKEPPPPRFLMHGFSGSLETARELARRGAWFSSSGMLLGPRGAKALAVFRQLPRERIVLETDAPMMPPPPAWIAHPLPDNRNHPANLPLIATGLAGALGLEPQQLASIAATNAAALLR